PSLVAPTVAPTQCNRGHSGSSAVTEGSTNESQNDGRGGGGNAGNVNGKPPVASAITGGHRVGLTGFEPATSWSRTKRSSQAELQPVLRSPGHPIPRRGIVNI